MDPTNTQPETPVMFIDNPPLPSVALRFLLPELLDQTFLHLPKSSLCKFLTINKQWFPIAIRHLWRKVDFMEFMKLVINRRSPSGRTGQSRAVTREVYHPKRKLSHAEAARLALYSPNIVTLLWSEEDSFISSTQDSLRELSRIIDKWCDIICIDPSNPAIWPNGAQNPSFGIATTKLDMSLRLLFPRLSNLGWSLLSQSAKLEFEVPLSPIHGLFHLSLTVSSSHFDLIQHGTMEASWLYFNNTSSSPRAPEDTLRILLSNLGQNPNLQVLELCLNESTQFVYSNTWKAYENIRNGFNSAEGNRQQDVSFASPLEHLIIRASFPEHLFIQLIDPTRLGTLSNLRHLHLHNTFILPRGEKRGRDGSSTPPPTDSGDESSPDAGVMPIPSNMSNVSTTSTTGWQPRPLDFTAFTGPATLRPASWLEPQQYSSRVLPMPPAFNSWASATEVPNLPHPPLSDLLEGLSPDHHQPPGVAVGLFTPGNGSDDSGTPERLPSIGIRTRYLRAQTERATPHPFVYSDQTLLEMIATSCPRLESLRLEGVWDLDLVTELVAPSVSAYSTRVRTPPVNLQLRVDFRGQDTAEQRTRALNLTMERARKQK